MIRKLDKTEYDRATSLALEVYIQCGAEDFDEEGLNSFKSFIFSEQLMNELVIYGAFDNENLVGIMGTKNEESPGRKGVTTNPVSQKIIKNKMAYVQA